MTSEDCCKKHSCQQASSSDSLQNDAEIALQGHPCQRSAHKALL